MNQSVLKFPDEKVSAFVDVSVMDKGICEDTRTKGSDRF